MLRLEGVRIVQEDFTLAADFDVPEGAIVAVLGPSGAGKSTLLGAISGFVPLSGGRILWKGADIGGLSPGARPLSILFQDNNLFPHLSIADNVALGLRPDLRLSTAQRQRVESALARVGLDGFGNRRPGTLSGGQQGRAALARVLLRARPLLLLDEPFSALGPALRQEMLGLVRAIARESGATVLMVTHEPRDAEAVADSVILVADGSALPPVGTAALMADPPPALRDYLGHRPS